MDSDRKKREVFHFLFLEWLLRISDPKLYIVKGGVNLRFFFHSPRYSEDMDIDVLGGAVHTLKKNGYKILEDAAFSRSLRMYGIDRLLVNDSSKAKQTETVQRFRVRLVTSAGEELPTKIEFSRRIKESLSHLVDRVDPEIARTYQRLAFPCPHYTGESAVLQKIVALANRELTQARDVFDLQVLADAGYLKHVKPAEVLKRSTLVEAGKNLHLLTHEDFAGHVLEYLEDVDRSRYEGKEAWDSMKETVAEVLKNGD
ncbi:MAG: nucleotidyl transferase AbiEii/AbiGii toxin family protein [Deltaproteobacteria bacterium]|nr:nucleotidyl transferase AbiEii/AbiGii toxin family protein [Deltaproteobacteria bacterium]